MASANDILEVVQNIDGAAGAKVEQVTGLPVLSIVPDRKRMDLYGLNIAAGFAGADYSFTNGEAFIIWILMAILINNCLKK